MTQNNNETPKVPTTFEIHANSQGRPYLKKVERKRNITQEGRGQWIPIGRMTDLGIGRVIKLNRENGLIVLPDEESVYRALILTE